MSLDIEKMKEIVEQNYATHVIQHYGEVGAMVLRSLLENLRALYVHINPETIKGSLIVFQRIMISDPPECLSGPAVFTDISYLAVHCDTQRSPGTTVIQVIDTNQYHVWKDVSVTVAELSSQAIVYSFVDGKERIHVKNQSFDLINPSTSNLHASIFAMPAYRDLAAALEHYRWQSIKTSRCQIFSQAWHGGPAGNRIYFVKKPEEQMRKSLTHYLQDVLRNANVHPEINVDESHPVDIQITWLLTNRVAIIEIKWMGNSLSDSGNFIEYREARANEGAKQLADYLDAKHTWAPIHEVIGYLVVIDARRKETKPSSAAINAANGLWYKDKEIKFDPDFHKSRSDFAEPIRMFAEPKCSPN